MVERTKQDNGTTLKFKYLCYEAVILLSGFFHLIGHIRQPHQLSLHLLPPGFWLEKFTVQPLGLKIPQT